MPTAVNFPLTSTPASNRPPERPSAIGRYVESAYSSSVERLLTHRASARNLGDAATAAWFNGLIDEDRKLLEANFALLRAALDALEGSKKTDNE